MGAPIAPKWIKSASSTANAKTLENTADGGYQEVDALSADVKAALTGAASPSAENPFATVALATTSAAGLMSAADKAKLNSSLAMMIALS